MTATRSTKGYGGTAYQNGKELDGATELEGDFASIFAEVNGSISDENVPAGADISTTKIAGAPDATADADPGTTASPVSSTTLEEEILFLRNKIAANHVGDNAFYQTFAAVPAQAAYQEDPTLGSNMLRNSSFEIVDAGATPANLPPGWDNIAGTPTFTQNATTAALGAGQELNVAAGAAARHGESQTIKGIKSDTKYLVGAWVKANAGSVDIQTSGGLAAGDYQDLTNFGTSSGTYSPLAAVIQSDAIGTDIVFSIGTGVTGADDIDIDHAFFYEMAAHKATQSTRISQMVTVSAAQAISGDATTVTGLTATVTPPAHNYMIAVRVYVAWGALQNIADKFSVQGRLMENIAGGGANTVMTAGGMNVGTGIAEMWSSQLVFEHIVTDPVPGSSYVYTVEMDHDATNYEVQPEHDAHGNAQTDSRLVLECIPI